MFLALTSLLSKIDGIFTPDNLKDAGRRGKWVAACGIAALMACVWSQGAAAQAAQTTTVLTVTSGGAGVTTVAAGSVVTLTAAVNAGATAVTTGQVNFCDARAAYCTDIHILGMAQLTSAGTATVRMRPGLGSHSYKAVFAGTISKASSASAASGLTVTGTAISHATTTTIAQTGSWGNYALTGTVTEYGGTASPSGTVSFVDTSNGNLVLGATAPGPSVAGVSWPNPQGQIMNYAGRAVALGDFNGDGIPDLALSSGGSSSPLVILLGNANGTYTNVPTPTLNTYSFAPIVVADLNGDGNQDLAVLNADAQTVEILLGNGDGTFNVVASSSATGGSPNQLVAGDFNGDGIPDLAVTSDATNSVTVLLGNGDGTYTATANSPIVGSSPYWIVTGDFNGDGKQDLAVSDMFDDTLSILLGIGDGTFAAATSVHCGSNGSPLAMGDFNLDGKLDPGSGSGEHRGDQRLSDSSCRQWGWDVFLTCGWAGCDLQLCFFDSGWGLQRRWYS